jgi:prevent-host-death family protein
MQTFNIHDAKTHFSKLIEAVTHGEQVIIARAGKPIARLMAISAQTHDRKPGALKGQIRIASDFDAPLPDDIAASFNGQ